MKLNGLWYGDLQLVTNTYLSPHLPYQQLLIITIIKFVLAKKRAQCTVT